MKRIRTKAGKELLSWRGNHAKWTEQRWIDAIVAIEEEARGVAPVAEKVKVPA